ncbi:hypothetical protein HYH03_005517 [Edaphochlamys debaryana]|uniref:Uncharacterized protein n=1 Tax=Edaphochlamys debaryana TaxID=47281 RepID=A0A836C275_9CHLO|nr:hypothetical protein HYH03_005517 [Edaphochlamys debaryana]|eukprot:KAG2496284.1 hypothetical protein HYH03_005517 [Edaphochlamys debaryana]
MDATCNSPLSPHSPLSPSPRLGSFTARRVPRRQFGSPRASVNDVAAVVIWGPAAVAVAADDIAEAANAAADTADLVMCVPWSPRAAHGLAALDTCLTPIDGPAWAGRAAPPPPPVPSDSWQEPLPDDLFSLSSSDESGEWGRRGGGAVEGAVEDSGLAAFAKVVSSELCSKGRMARRVPRSWGGSPPLPPQPQQHPQLPLAAA